jgi:hypothetical protein
MSWSIAVPESPGNEIIQAIYAAPVTGQDVNLTHVYKATEAAKEAVVELISSGALGDFIEHSYRVSLNGHANVGHQPDAHWTNDCMTISISQTDDKPAS